MPTRRSPQPFEREGFVNAVVFPTGYALHGGLLALYFGAADTHVGVARFRLQELLSALSH